MPRFKATADGMIPFTAEEELEADLREAQYLAGEQSRIVNRFKGIYMDVVNAKLEALDYDSLATVKVWEGDATFGTEATRILTWYKNIIAMNYQLLNDVQNSIVPLPTDTEYKAMVEAVVF